MSYLEELFGLKSKVAVVTGGTGVLGSAMCKSLAKAGAAVVILGRRKEAADSLAKEIIRSGGNAIGISADVLNEQQLVNAKKLVIEKFGTIDILINCAGGNMPGAVVMPDKTFLDLKIDDFQKVVDLNLTGTVLPAQIFGEVLVSKKHGIIINISSMTAIRPLTRVVGYGAAKAAISNFTQWLSVEMAKKFGEGIRVNAIAPGAIRTEGTDKNLWGDPHQRERMTGRIPMRRFGTPEDIANTLLFLLSDVSGYITGEVITVDGGAWIGKGTYEMIDVSEYDKT